MNLALHAVKNTAIGIKILAEWIGAGGNPVAPELSESRAAVCVECPENRAPNWWEIHSNAIALTIREMLEFKNEVGFRVTNENKLHMCRVCGCCNRLKVHAPIDHIRKHTLPEVMSAYPPHCWIKKEKEKELSTP